MSDSPTSSLTDEQVAAIRAWREAASAPQTGEHILVSDFDRHGFGVCGGVLQHWCAVVHWWSNPGEEGFYLSSGALAPHDDRPMAFTHWMPLPQCECPGVLTDRDRLARRVEELEAALAASATPPSDETPPERAFLPDALEDALRHWSDSYAGRRSDLSVRYGELVAALRQWRAPLVDTGGPDPACNCYKYEHQVCDICQGVTGDETDAPSPAQETR